MTLQSLLSSMAQKKVRSPWPVRASSPNPKLRLLMRWWLKRKTLALTKTKLCTSNQCQKLCQVDELSNNCPLKQGKQLYQQSKLSNNQPKMLTSQTNPSTSPRSKREERHSCSNQSLSKDWRSTKKRSRRHSSCSIQKSSNGKSNQFITLVLELTTSDHRVLDATEEHEPCLRAETAMPTDFCVGSATWRETAKFQSSLQSNLCVPPAKNRCCNFHRTLGTTTPTTGAPPRRRTFELVILLTLELSILRNFCVVSCLRFIRVRLPVALCNIKA